MAAYYQVEVTLNSQSVEVGIPSPQRVNVTIPLVGPAGPAGPAGTGLETLTTPGDTLYQGASTGQRLPIGSAGQVLKVVNGLPAWANESGAVTSVNGATGAVVLDADDVGATPALEYLSDTLSTAGPTDVLANKHYTFIKTFNGTTQIYLPETANEGDRVVVRSGSVWTSGAITISRLGGSPFIQTIGVLTGPNTVFFAVWTGLWRQDFVPPAGFQSPPESISALGAAGQLAYQDPHLYICVDTNKWRRVTLTTF